MMYKIKNFHWLKLGIAIIVFSGLYLFVEHDTINDQPSTTYNTRLIAKLPDYPFILKGIVQLSDGDSLEFTDTSRRARLFGIDSPELAQKMPNKTKKLAMWARC